MPKPLTGLASKMSPASKLRIKKPKTLLWQGPQSNDPQGGVTQSLLNDFLTCRERFRVEYLEGLQPEYGFSKVLEFGNMWHVCEEHFAGGKDWQKALLTYSKKLLVEFKLQQPEIVKWYEIVKRMFPVYIKHWSKQKDVQKRTPLMQEEVFCVPYELPSGKVVYLKGKFDSVDLIDKHTDQGFKYPKGIWLQEDKTKGDIDEQNILQRLSFDIQTMIYLIALQEVPNAVIQDWPIIGVRYNVIRRPFSGGVGSIKQKQPSKSNPKGETAEEYYERFMNDYVLAEPEYWFQRWKSLVSQADIQRFKLEFLNPILEQLCQWYEVVSHHMLNGDLEAIWTDRESLHYRLPFGTYNTIMETGGSDLDEYFKTGSEVGLYRRQSLFSELQTI